MTFHHLGAAAYEQHAEFCPWHEDQRASDCTCMGIPERCGHLYRPGLYCSRAKGHVGPCALWPVSHEAQAGHYQKPAQGQARIDSLMEALTNTAVGFVVSLVTWIFVAAGMGIPMTWGENLLITGIFTVVSIVRQYVLRRAFDGKTVWQALKGRFA